MYIQEYRILKQLQHGGQASLYKCLMDDRQYALKVFPSSCPHGYFNNEVHYLERLSHKNIVPSVQILCNCQAILTQSRQIQRVDAIAMPFACNGDLYEEVRMHGYLQDGACKYILASVLSALVYLHSQHILHKDLKPENILLGEGYNVMLADFGLSVNLKQQAITSKSLPSRTNLYGNYHFAAPEILKSKAATFQSEIFSFGILAFYLHIGRVPFTYAKITDRNYRLLVERNWGKFWEYHQSYDHRVLSPQFKNFIKLILQPIPHRRANYEQIIESQWLEGQIGKKDFEEMMGKRHSSHKPNLCDTGQGWYTSADFIKPSSEQYQDKQCSQFESYNYENSTCIQ